MKYLEKMFVKVAWKQIARVIYVTFLKFHEVVLFLLIFIKYKKK